MKRWTAAQGDAMRSERLMQKWDGRKMCKICRKYIRVGEAIVRTSLGADSRFEAYRHVTCIREHKGDTCA